MRAICVSTMLFCVACGGEDSGPCAETMGSYRIRFTEQSGNCDAGDFERVANFDAPGAGEGCDGTRNVSDDMCTIDFDITCEDTGLRTIGTLESNENGTYVEGTAEFRFPDCSSIYTVSYEKL